MTAEEVPTFREGMRSALRAWREHRGWRQEEVAKLMVVAGFDWKRKTVAAVERGDRWLTPEELLVLASVLGIGDTGSYPEGVAERVAVTPHTSLNLLRLLNHLTTVVPRHVGLRWDVPDEGYFKRDDANVLRMIRGNGLDAPLPTDWQRAVAENGKLDTERRLADALDLEGMGFHGDLAPFVVAAASHFLWGRTLSDERDARALERAPDASPASLRTVAGHVTHELLAQLREHFDTPYVRKIASIAQEGARP